MVDINLSTTWVINQAIIMRLLYILRLSSPFKIRDGIVCSVIIFMEDYYILSFRFRRTEEFHNHLVEWWFFTFTIPSKVYSVVFTSIISRFTDLGAAFSSYLAFITHLVGRVSPLFPSLFRVGEVSASLFPSSHPPAIWGMKIIHAISPRNHQIPLYHRMDGSIDR